MREVHRPVRAFKFNLCPHPVSYSQTALPVPSPVSGVIEELFVPDGEKVNAGDQLCKIRITGVCMHGSLLYTLK